jgi:hypothetical protein
MEYLRQHQRCDGEATAEALFHMPPAVFYQEPERFGMVESRRVGLW